MRRPIVFIHGFGGGKQEYTPIIRFLTADSTVTCYQFSYDQKFGQISLSLIADKLNEYVSANVSETAFDIVALSQGGIIARSYIARYHDRQIGACVTVCTPHRGSLLARIGILPGIKELAPSSSFLRNLDSEKTAYYAIYNPLDLMVFPGTYARFDSARENKKILTWTHPLTFSHPLTLAYIKRVLAL